MYVKMLKEAGELEKPKKNLLAKVEALYSDRPWMFIAKAASILVKNSFFVQHAEVSQKKYYVTIFAHDCVYANYRNFKFISAQLTPAKALLPPNVKSSFKHNGTK